MHDGTEKNDAKEQSRDSRDQSGQSNWSKAGSVLLVLTNVLGGRIRLVTHRDVTAGDIEETIRRWAEVTGPGEGGKV